MQLGKPLISVIIPTFNREEYIREAIDSVIVQSYDNWECIVVDDGSTDNTTSIIKDYQKKDKRIRLLIRDTEPKGASTCRNIGLNNSRGEYIIFLDSDDCLSGSCLENRLKQALNFPQFDFWVFKSVMFSQKVGDSEFLWNIDKEKPDIERFLAMDVPWCIMSVFWKKNIINQLGGFYQDARAWQDWELHIRAITSNLNYKKFNIVDNYYRRAQHNKIGGEVGKGKHVENLIGLIAYLYNDDDQLKSHKFLVKKLLFFLLLRTNERVRNITLRIFIKDHVLTYFELLVIFLYKHWPIKRGKGLWYSIILSILKVNSLNKILDQQTFHKIKHTQVILDTIVE